MFGTIRRHQTWLWAVIITLTIISFVIFFSPYSKMNNSGRRAGNYGAINGQRVTDLQYANAYREVDLHTFLMSGGNRIEMETTLTTLLRAKYRLADSASSVSF